MTTDQIIVLGGAVVGIIAVYWFFLGKRSTTVRVSGDIEIIVDGGYTPDVIEIPVSTQTTIHFLRKDPSSCLEEVVISEFKIRRTLPLNERTDVQITPTKPGSYPFTCGMGMYHGSIIVK